MAITLYKHPEYEANYDQWVMFRDLFQGDHDTLVSPIYLWKHVLEDNDTPIAARIRGLRQLRSRYQNTIEPVISRYLSLFFKEKLVVDSETQKLIANFDYTGRGHSIDAFFQNEVLEKYLVYGRVFVIADRAATEIVNQEQDSLIKPTLEALSPLDVPDWEIETEDPKRLGKLRFIRTEYAIIEPRNNAQEQPKAVRYSKEYRYQNNIYTVTTWREAEGKKNESKTNETQWDLVSSFDFNDYKDIPIKYLFSESWIKDVAQETLRLFNFMSSRDNILYHQAYQRTFFIGNLNAQQEKAVAEYTAAVLPENTVVTTIEPANPVALDQAIERSVNAIFRMAFKQNRTVSAESKAVESSDSQQESKEQLVSLILSEIDRFEKLINDSIKDLLSFMDRKKEFTTEIKLTRDIQDADIDKQIQIYATLRDEINSVPEWREETLQKFIEFQDIADDAALKIAESIKLLPSPSTGRTVDARSVILNRLNGNTERNTDNA